MSSKRQPSSAAAKTPAATAEEVEALDITGSAVRRPAEGDNGNALGNDIFTRTRESIDQLEQVFRVHEADLAAYEAALAEAKEAFQEDLQESTVRHLAQEAVAGMRTRQLEGLREETSMEVAGLDTYGAKLRAMESRVDAKSTELASREASSEEAVTKLHNLLVAVIAREKKITDEIAWLEELHESHLAKVREAHKVKLATQTEKIRTELYFELDEALAKKAQDYDVALSALEKENAALWEQAIGEQQDREMLHECVQKTGELLAMRAREIDELKQELAKADEYCTAVEQGRNTGIERLWDAADRATTAAQRLSMTLPERD